ncbi:LOW QUALITY PROTEIN: serine/threonine-protein kinase 11-interacting protein [Microplitis mediator]|uniref:LOW QUALITY PROTEIN: serine/threonine-protein kinase 11-interacting protein n=1 Tax=Microplitis mediator TaxID=375433 RepID=UPI00255310B0|nr:LOW QUALITY PROTEIN: serine/threonine-protein kinase 11-interacting protein [Microplitis mediator]
MSIQSSSLPSKPEILELAKILRKNGDQVLSGTSKLSLSTKLLHDLNNGFSLIVDDTKDFECSFQVCNNSEIEIFRDLKFLHDFVQKTIWLKIININDPVTIDITKFRHLRFLELQKVFIDSVRGIQGIRGQLESIYCTGNGGVGSVGRLLSSCGGDACVGFVWASLKRLSLPYNNLGRLDKSLELAPWLSTLDLSHNFISNANELDCLPNLKYINLSYNKLESIPSFNRSSYRTITIVVFKNNYIDDLSGLEKLDCLSELDISYNCLLNHSVLWPISSITSLIWLNLIGNPLYYHDKHRSSTLRYLHAALAENKFTLDEIPLSKSEKNLVSDNRAYTIRGQNKLNERVCLPVEIDCVAEIVCVAESEKKRRTIVKEVDIDDLSDEFEVIGADGNEIDQGKAKEKAKGRGRSNDRESVLETSMDHLETKKKILELREKFGGDWLRSHAGSVVQDIMGLDKYPVASTPRDFNDLEEGKNIECDNGRVDDSLKISEDGLVETNDRVEEQRDGVGDQKDETEEQDDDFQEDNNEFVEQKEEVYDPDEEIGDLFIVSKKNPEEEIFLVITNDDVIERDSITGKIKYRWSIETVLSCIMGRGETTSVDFIFDTTRRDRQSRMYYADGEDALKIVRLMAGKIKKRPIVLKIFKCMKCSTHFSQDPDYVVGIGMVDLKPTCPACKSLLVIQTDELMTPDDKADENGNGDAEGDGDKINFKLSRTTEVENVTTMDLRHSESQSSIGGIEDGALSITTSLVCSDSQNQAQVCCSATSLEDSRESTPSTGTVMKKYESDIEILSNPSQSSIEVLDDGSKSSTTPNRKKSSEERRIAIAPSLLTIPDTTPIMAGLTESSSSGSLTDSICTTYENKQKTAKTPTKIPVKNQIDEVQSGSLGSIKESPYTPVSNLTSMLGGLLSSMKIGAKNSALKADEPEYLSTDIQYSFTNFTSVDHRIKLHLILNIFELENEELVLFLRSEILLPNQIKPFAGCLVLSTSKIYILKITGIEGEDPSRWLHKEISWTMDRVRTFAPLPFKQGITIEPADNNSVDDNINNSLNLLCILQDFQRTSNLLFYLTDLPLPTSCEVEFTINENSTSLMHQLMAGSKYHKENDAVRIFAIFSFANLDLGDRDVKINMAGLLVTTSSLIITEDKMHWLLPEINEEPVKLTEQSISNLIEVISDGCTLGLNFLDEVAGIEELWTFKFVSNEAANAVINAIQPPWEELFSVPLQITTKTCLDTIS